MSEQEINNPAGGNVVKVDVAPEPELEDNTPKDDEEIVYQPSNFDIVAQKMLDALREAWNLDPTGEHRAVVVAVTTSNGKSFYIMADSTEDQRFKDWEVWSKYYVESEVVKAKAAFSKGLADTNKAPVDS